MKILLKRLFACCMAVCMVVTMCSVLFTVSAAQTGTVTVDTVDATTADTEKVVPVTIQAADSGLKAAQIWLGVPDLSIAKIELKGEELSKLTATYVDATEANVVLDSFGSYVSTTAPKVYDNGQISILVESDELIKTAIVIEITFAGTFVEDTTYDITVGEDTQAGYDKNEDLIELAKTNGAIVVGAAHVHNYVPVVTDPTCTAQGYTTYTCACEDSYVNNYVDALGHDFAYTDLGDGNHSVDCSRCDDADVASEAHNFVDGTCDKCGAKEAPAGPVEDPSLATAFQSFKMKIATAFGFELALDLRNVTYDDFELVVSKKTLDKTTYAETGGVTQDVLDDTNYNPDRSYPKLPIYRWDYTNIALYEMSHEITFTLYVTRDGVVYYADCGSTTLATKANEYYTENFSDPVKRSFAVDLLNLGTTAQVHFANKDTTDPKSPLKTYGLPNATVDQQYATNYGTLKTVDGVKDAAFTNVRLSYIEAPSLYYSFRATNYKTPANLTFSATYYSKSSSSDVIETVNGADLSASELAYAHIGGYFYSFDKIKLYDGDKVVTLTISATDGTEWTYQYSVEAFLADNIDKTAEGTLKNLYIATAAFGASARNFWPNY